MMHLIILLISMKILYMEISAGIVKFLKEEPQGKQKLSDKTTAP